VKVELKESEDLQRKLSIEVEPDMVQAIMEKKFLEIRRTAELKGFRKGKAPLDIIKSLYADQVKLDAADDLIRETFTKAIEEKTLHVATRPKVTDLDYKEDGSFVYTAVVEVFPEIEKVNHDGLTFETINTEASDDEVEEVTEAYRKRFSDLRPLDREVRDGDVVVADLKKLFDPKNAVPQDSFAGSEIDLGNKMTVKEFREELPGMKAGEEKELTVKYDPDYPDPNFAGAEIRYHCKVKEVKERVLPEFNDAFAKSTGMAETALELKIKFREDIKKHKEDGQKRTRRREIIRQICENNQISVPTGLVNEYLDSVVEDYRKQNAQFDEAEVREQYRQIGINSMQWDFLWHTLAKQEGIEVLPEDTENWINGFAAANNTTPKEAEETLRQSGRAANLRESIHEEKVLEFLIDKATETPVKK